MPSSPAIPRSVTCSNPDCTSKLRAASTISSRVAARRRCLWVGGEADREMGLTSVTTASIVNIVHG